MTGLSGREATPRVGCSFVDGGCGSKRDPLGSWVVPLGFATLEIKRGPAAAGVERPETQCGGPSETPHLPSPSYTLSPVFQRGGLALCCFALGGIRPTAEGKGRNSGQAQGCCPCCRPCYLGVGQSRKNQREDSQAWKRNHGKESPGRPCPGPQKFLVFLEEWSWNPLVVRGPQPGQPLPLVIVTRTQVFHPISVLFAHLQERGQFHYIRDLGSQSLCPKEPWRYLYPPFPAPCP